MVSSLVSRLVILVFGTLYPAYASYKAVKTKNVKEHVKWMMYWIVFALFTCVETITDVLFSWFPFYYEIKIIIVIWLLSPATRGSSILYRKFVHPTLASKEQEIDDYIAKAKERSYRQVLDLGSKGVNVLMQTAIKNFGLPTLMPSLSDPAISERVDKMDGILRSQSAQQMATIEECPSEDDEEMDHYENVNPKAKSVNKPTSKQRNRAFSSDDETDLCEPTDAETKVKTTKVAKVRGRPGTRKSSRKIKTEYNEFSD